MNVLTNLNLNKNQLQNAVIHPLATAPSNPTEGQIYYNSADKVMYQFDGTQWSAIGAVLSVNGKTGVVVLTKADINLGNVDNTSDATKKSNFTGSIANGNTGFATGGDVFTELAKKLNLSGGTMSGELNMGSNKISGVADAVNDNDAVNLKQLKAVQVGALKPSGSITFANLPALTATNVNNLYNITDAFTTTADFVEGAGKSYPAGTNVAIINTGTASSPVYKYDAYTGVIDLSPYLKKSDLATGTGTSAETAMTQKATTDAISGLIKTATGTIATTATSAEVAYTGTLIEAYATMGGVKVALDITIAAAKVTFTCANAPTSAVTCTVVYA